MCGESSFRFIDLHDLHVPLLFEYRYCCDRDGTVVMDLHVQNLAVVLLKHYSCPQEARGQRGASGSGRGIRTLLEYGNLGMYYWFSAINNQMDVKVKVGITSSDDDVAVPSFLFVNSGHSASSAEVPAGSVKVTSGGSSFDCNNGASSRYFPGSSLMKRFVGEGTGPGNKEEGIVASKLSVQGSELIDTPPYVNFNNDHLLLSAVKLAAPTALFPLQNQQGQFSPESCDIVTCYEDIMFCTTVVTKFLGLNEAAPAATPEFSRESTNTADTTQRNDFGIINNDNSETHNKAAAPSPWDSVNIFSVIHMRSIRVVIVDNVLGLHLPLFQVTLISIFFLFCCYLCYIHRFGIFYFVWYRFSLMRLVAILVPPSLLKMIM
jgi:hypothetical protein